MKKLAIIAAAVLAAAPAYAETECTIETQAISAAGSALTGNTSPRIWVVQQCADEDGTVRTSVAMCELENDVAPGNAPTCSAQALIGDAVSKPAE